MNLGYIKLFLKKDNKSIENLLIYIIETIFPAAAVVAVFKRQLVCVTATSLASLQTRTTLTITTLSFCCLHYNY